MEERRDDARAARPDRVANVYTIDQAAGVIDAAEEAEAPVILQAHPGGRGPLLAPLAASLRVLADVARVPVAVHLDHTSDRETLRWALEAGFDSLMADGSQLSFTENVDIVRWAKSSADPLGIAVEGELGRLAGAEDGLPMSRRAARMTDPATAAEFLAATQVDALAVCVGNVHGAGRGDVRLDMVRLEQIASACLVPLVLHGASGLDAPVLAQAVQMGVNKVNINTERRHAYRHGLAGGGIELTDVLGSARAAAVSVALRFIATLGSARIPWRGLPSGG